ncbi:MAG: radical SAM protein, partial [Algiphilus sp.]|uniref:radical SAM protein n=1 Tax=Algiphilus sp. TaxID=1872431 RepID=UPI0025B837BA
MPTAAPTMAAARVSHPSPEGGRYRLPVPEALIARYDGYAPRYTSYPTAAEFRSDFDAGRLDAAIAAGNLLPDAPDLSLYLHLPFCREACWYCACHRAITHRPERAARYLEALYQEVAHRGDQIAGHRRVRQLHLGGGTPTFYRMEELAGLLAHIARHFPIAEHAEREWSIEIDPRTVAPDQAKALVAMGFDRVSMGIQDFDPTVQQAIHRQQDVRMVRALVESVRAAGVRGISFDLIYGLPWQTVAGFRRTLRVVKQLRPDRVSIY